MAMYQLIILATCLLVHNVNSDPNYRLNTPIKPSAYSISLTPYFDTNDDRAFTFDGEVSIVFKTDVVTNQIKLHSENLTFTSGNISVAGASQIALNETNPLEFDTFYTFAYINLLSNLQVDAEYVLNIVYTGPIRDDLNGFYRNYYIENGVKKWLGATQMEPTHARKVFPCFDEPELKATFALTIDRPESYKPTLANTKLQSSTPLANGYVREVFLPTPRMSTYLVAFLISEFEAARYNVSGDKEFGVFTRPQAVNQSEYAFDFGLRVVEELGKYFGIDYYSTNPNLKLDHIALINFRAGAMENWGLITYREALLLYVPEESTPYYKYRVAQIIAHETTHMWFGNLVTCHWWSNTWLNEGFANYFQDYITSLIEPEVGAGNQLVIGSVYSAYDADDSPTSAAITNDDVNSPAEISGHFGTISYQKAGSVIRMMHHLLGDDAFRTGLNTYLRSNEFNSGYPNYMYAGLQEGVNTHNALTAYPGATVASVMGSWITQAGHPVLDVKVDYENNTVTLSQRRFYINGSYSSDEIYKIPITYTTGVLPNFANTKPLFILEEKTISFNVSNIGERHSWIIFNLQETGLYRVKYDDHAYQIIASTLKGSQRTEIHHLNRAKIVNDLFAFFYADEINFGLLNEVLQFLHEETEYTVWYAAIRGLNKLRNIYMGTDALADIEQYSLSLMENVINYLGYEERETDDFETLRNRMQILEFACKLGHAGCIEHAAGMFKNFVETGARMNLLKKSLFDHYPPHLVAGKLVDLMERQNLYILNSFFRKPVSRKWTWISPDGKVKNEIDFIMSTKKHLFNDVSVINAVKWPATRQSPIQTISPSLRPVAYCSGLREGGESDYEFLWQRSKTTNVANEARLIGEVLGCTNHEDSLKKFLVSMLEENSPIMSQDLTVPLSGVLGNYKHVPLVIEDLKSNLTAWNSIYPSMDTVYTSIASALHNEAEIVEFEEWLRSCEECGSKDGALDKLSQVRATAQWAQTHKADVLSSVGNAANMFFVSLFTIAAGFALTLTFK